jgi:hypothetical protein
LPCTLLLLAYPVHSSVYITLSQLLFKLLYNVSELFSLLFLSHIN